MRDRLIELLREEISIGDYNFKLTDRCSDIAIETLADHLLANAVTIAPCKIGDKVYQVDNGGRIYTSTINNVMYCTGTIAFDERAIGKNVFLSEEALKGGVKE